jgi:methylthioribose-1-phosphate isomerase
VLKAFFSVIPRMVSHGSMLNRAACTFIIVRQEQVKNTTDEDEVVRLLKENNRILTENRKSILELQRTFAEMKDMLHKIVINTS